MDRENVQLPHDMLFLVFNEAACIPAPFDYYDNLEGNHWSTLIKAQNNEQHNSYNALTILSLVSKRWNATATPLLHRSLRLMSPRQISNSGETLQYRHMNPAPWVGVAVGCFINDLDIGEVGRSQIQH